MSGQPLFAKPHRTREGRSRDDSTPSKRRSAFRCPVVRASMLPLFERVQNDHKNNGDDPVIIEPRSGLRGMVNHINTCLSTCGKRWRATPGILRLAVISTEGLGQNNVRTTWIRLPICRRFPVSRDTVDTSSRHFGCNARKLAALFSISLVGSPGLTGCKARGFMALTRHACRLAAVTISSLTMFASPVGATGSANLGPRPSSNEHLQAIGGEEAPSPASLAREIRTALSLGQDDRARDALRRFLNRPRLDPDVLLQVGVAFAQRELYSAARLPRGCASFRARCEGSSTLAVASPGTLRVSVLGWAASGISRDFAQGSETGARLFSGAAAHGFCDVHGWKTRRLRKGRGAGARPPTAVPLPLLSSCRAHAEAAVSSGRPNPQRTRHRQSYYSFL